MAKGEKGRDDVLAQKAPAAVRKALREKNVSENFLWDFSEMIQFVSSDHHYKNERFLILLKKFESTPGPLSESFLREFVNHCKVRRSSADNVCPDSHRVRRAVAVTETETFYDALDTFSDDDNDDDDDDDCNDDFDDCNDL